MPVTPRSENGRLEDGPLEGTASEAFCLEDTCPHYLKEGVPHLTPAFVADLLEFTSDEGSFATDLLPHLQDCAPFQACWAVHERLQHRFCHPHPTLLHQELVHLEDQLRCVLQEPEAIPQRLAQPWVGDVNHEALASWALCLRLCESCIDIATRDPQRGLAVARAACAVAQHLPARDYRPAEREQLLALAWAHLANVHRIPGHLQQARQAFEQVQARERYQSEEMAGLWAEIRWLFGTFLRDQRQLEAARLQLQDAIQLAQRGHRPQFATAALLNVASLDYEEGALGAAVERSRQALTLLDREQHPSWYADACVNVAYYLGRAGEGAAALAHLRRHLPIIRPLCRPGTLARIPWIEGAALRALGRPAEAAAKYEQARRAFFELKHGLYVALVTLELAIVHLEQGYTAEVQRLAAEILPVFQMQGIDREARATLELFRHAVATEHVTLLQLQRWLGRLGA